MAGFVRPLNDVARSHRDVTGRACALKTFACEWRHSPPSKDDPWGNCCCFSWGKQKHIEMMLLTKTCCISGWLLIVVVFLLRAPCEGDDYESGVKLNQITPSRLVIKLPLTLIHLHSLTLQRLPFDLPPFTTPLPLTPPQTHDLLLWVWPTFSSSSSFAFYAIALRKAIQLDLTPTLNLINVNRRFTLKDKSMF